MQRLFRGWRAATELGHRAAVDAFWTVRAARTPRCVAVACAYAREALRRSCRRQRSKSSTSMRPAWLRCVVPRRLAARPRAAAMPHIPHAQLRATIREKEARIQQLRQQQVDMVRTGCTEPCGTALH